MQTSDYMEITGDCVEVQERSLEVLRASIDGRIFDGQGDSRAARLEAMIYLRKVLECNASDAVKYFESLPKKTVEK